MPSDCTPTEVLDTVEEHYAPHILYKEDKVQSFEMGFEDSDVADGADESSRPSSPSSGGGGETADLAGSPLLQNAVTTDEEAEHEPAPLVTAPPLLTAHHPHRHPPPQPQPVKLSSSAPAGGSRGLLSGRRAASPPEKLSGRPEHEKTPHTPQQSPSLRPAATPPVAAVSPAGLTSPPPPSAPVLLPRTPPLEMRTQPASAKVVATTPPSLQARTPPAREAVRPMPALEVPPSPLPAPLVATDFAAPRLRAHSSPAASPRAPIVLDDEPDVCCICLEEYSDDNPMFRGECQHHFHLACLMEWKQRSNSCPMCCAETLHGVGDMTTPQSKKKVDPAEVARQREIAARDEELAHRLQRKYLLRAQHRQQLQRASFSNPPAQVQEPTQVRQAALTTRVSPSLTPSRSPQLQARPQRNITPLPPLPAAAAPSSASPQTTRYTRAATGTSAAAAASPPTAAPLSSATPTRTTPTRPTPAPAAARTASSKKSKSRKSDRATPTQASPSGHRPRSTSPAVHPQFHSDKSSQRSRRRNEQNGCVLM